MKKYIHAGMIALKRMKEFFVNFIGLIGLNAVLWTRGSKKYAGQGG